MKDASTKAALIAATVRIVGTGSGTVTDFDGAFSVRVPPDADKLQVSYTGYTTVTVAIPTDGAPLNIELTPEQ